MNAAIWSIAVPKNNFYVIANLWLFEPEKKIVFFMDNQKATISSNFNVMKYLYYS